jgi:hypothetical protein
MAISTGRILLGLNPVHFLPRRQESLEKINLWLTERKRGLARGRIFSNSKFIVRLRHRSSPWWRYPKGMTRRQTPSKSNWDMT